MKYRVVISGSFQKHLDAIGVAIKNFKKMDVFILAPKTTETKNNGTDFIFLTTDDPNKLAGAIEEEFLSLITQANFLYIANVDGYIGQSVAVEISTALLNQIPIICAEKIKTISEEIPKRIRTLLLNLVFEQIPINEICLERIEKIFLSPSPKSNFSSEEIDEMQSLTDHLIEQLKCLPKNMSNLILPQNPTLQNFQTYVTQMVKERGFDQETASELFMLFLEECGEMAKAARKTQKIKTDNTSESFHLDHEIADVFIYLLDICNHFHINLEKAFREKEEINKNRVWK